MKEKYLCCLTKLFKLLKKLTLNSNKLNIDPDPELDFTY